MPNGSSDPDVRTEHQNDCAMFCRRRFALVPKVACAWVHEPRAIDSDFRTSPVGKAGLEACDEGLQSVLKHASDFDGIPVDLKLARVLSIVLSGQNATKLEELEASRKWVGMVGDRINDALTMTRPDVYLDIGTGTRTDLARAGACGADEERPPRHHRRHRADARHLTQDAPKPVGGRWPTT